MYIKIKKSANVVESLSSKSEEVIVKHILLRQPLRSIGLTLTAVTNTIMSWTAIPPVFQTRLLRRILRLMRQFEFDTYCQNTYYYFQYIPHPCSSKHMRVGEMWELLPEELWLCQRCGKPLYTVSEVPDP